MPAIITHSFFADDVFEEIKSSKLKEEIIRRRNLFRLGAQGPDIFFYYKAQPWIKYDGIEKLHPCESNKKIYPAPGLPIGKGFFFPLVLPLVLKVSFLQRRRLKKTMSYNGRH